MKLLTYFARAYAGIFLLVQMSLVIIVVATTLVENASFVSRSDEAGLTVLVLAALSAVQFGYQVLPVACFLAALVTGTVLARSGELLAAQAAGISTVRVGSAFAAVCLLICTLGAIAGEYGVPRATARLSEVRQGDVVKGDTLTKFYKRQSQWFREGDKLLYIPAANPETQIFSNVVVYRFDQGLVTSVMDAKTLRRAETAWLLEDVRTHDLATGLVTQTPVQPLTLRVSPRDLIDITGDPRVMRSPDIVALAKRREVAGFDITPYVIEAQSRWAYPLSGLVMFLLAVPWMLNPSRRRSLAVNLGAGVVGVGILLSLTYVFRLLALARRVPTPLGAWGINLLCLLLVPLSVFLYQRYRTRGTIW